MDRKFLLSVVVTFFLSMGLGFIVHELLLGADYARLPLLFRRKDEMDAYLPFMLLAHVLIAAGFVWIYRQGRQEKPYLGQGIRFGAAVAVLMTIPVYLIYYAVQPMPGLMVAKQVAFDTAGVILMGIAVAWMYRSPGED